MASAIGQAEVEVVEILHRLLRIDTSNPGKAERPAAEAVAELLIGRLAMLLAECAGDAARFPNLHFFDTTLIPIEPAAPGSSGESGDWINEIHLNRSGCRKLAVPWAT